jgi:hypothetical protein
MLNDVLRALHPALFIVMWVLIIGNWVSAIILIRASEKHPAISTLRERAIGAVTIALVMTIAFLVWINSLFKMQIIGGDITLFAAGFAIAACSMPSLYWLYLYFIKYR